MVLCAFHNPRHCVLLETLFSKLTKSLLALVIFWEYDWTTLQENAYSVVPELHTGDLRFPSLIKQKWHHQSKRSHRAVKVGKQKIQPVFCIVCSLLVIFAMRNFCEKESREEIGICTARKTFFEVFKEFASTCWRVNACHNWEKLDVLLPCVFMCIILHNSFSDAQCCHLPPWLLVCLAQLSELEDVATLRWKGGSSPAHTQFKAPLEGSCPCIGHEGQ